MREKQIKQVTQNAEWNANKQHELKMQVGEFMLRHLESLCQNNLVFTGVGKRCVLMQLLHLKSFNGGHALIIKPPGWFYLLAL